MELFAQTAAFLKELENFSYDLFVLDHVWDVLFPDAKNTWHHPHVNKYKKTFYISHINGDVGVLEVEPKKSVIAMETMGNRAFPIEESGQKAAAFSHRPLRSNRTCPPYLISPLKGRVPLHSG